MDLPLSPVRRSTFDVRRKNAQAFTFLELCPLFAHRRTSNVERRANNSSAFIRQGGFTVLELFVATAILVLITGMLFSIFNQASNAWNNGAATIERQSNARIALEMLNRELASAYVSPLLSGNSIKFFGNPSSVYFIAAVPPSMGTNNGFGEFAYVLPSSTAPTNLFRYFTQPAANFRSSGSPLPGDFSSGDPIADNVLGLSLLYDDTNGNQFPSWDSTAIAKPTQLYQIPTVIEATMTMIDSKHAIHMPAAGPAYDTYTARYARTQSMVIHLQNAPTP